MSDRVQGLHVGKFAIGQPVPRNEDPRLLRGDGRYTDDLDPAGHLHAWVRRSDAAHGRLVRVETAGARALPGVLAVLTAGDLDAVGYGALLCTMPFKSQDGTPLRCPPRPALARDRVRHVGEAVAVVIATSQAIARDAAELIEVEIAADPAVVDPELALAATAPRLHEDVPGNLSLDWAIGDRAAVEAAFARAAHVTRLRLANNRVVVATMEPRGAVAEYDAAGGRFTLHVGCQGVMGMRSSLADVLKVPPEQVRVLAYDVGGSFGMKAPVYPEYVAILHAARALGRSVRWVDDRSGSFVSDQHGRDSIFDASLALDEEGHFLAVSVDAVANMGAWLTHVGPMIQTLNIQKNTPGAYRTPLIFVRSRCAFTNTMPIGAYRGAGRPEGVYMMERLIDQAARELGIDAVELRRRNLVAPDAMPFRSAAGTVYDSGDFPTVLETALAKADHAGFPARRRQSEARGRRRGLGVTYYLEVTAGPGKEMGGVRFTSDGRVAIVTGTLDYGQGHWTPFAQVLSQRLGIPFERIDLIQKDSDELIAGGGTGGSRSIMASGKAILAAAELVVAKGTELAAHALEAAAVDIRFADGSFTVAGTDRSIGLLELAQRQHSDPAGDGLPTTLDSELALDSPESAFPNGCHIAEVEVDPTTGIVELVRYTAVNDFGNLVNPMLVEGQVHGGVVQGIGQALLERTVYDEDGQLLTGSFMDYGLPRANDLTDFDIGFNPVPATTNPLGVKGCGEAGVAGSMPTIMNAVADALAGLGVAHLDMPATPERVWRAIQAAKGAERKAAA